MVQENEVETMFRKFQERWSLEKVKKMTLEEYIGLTSEGNRDDFTYWIRTRLDNLARTGGCDEGARYGIYQCKTKPKRDYGYDGIYAWQKKLGESKDEAFSKIKEEIIKVIQLSKENKLDEIDKCSDILFFGFKWKIAFHYQKINDIKLFVYLTIKSYKALQKESV